MVFPKFIGESPATYSKVSTNGKRTIGFLGRLHPIKKVENIIYAMNLLEPELRNKVKLTLWASLMTNMSNG